MDHNAPASYWFILLSTRLKSLSQLFYRWLLLPSSGLTEPDQRRKAALLSAFVLGVWLLAIPLQGVYSWLHAGIRGLLQPENVLILLGLPIVYALSRTRHLRLSSYLAIGTIVVVDFFAASKGSGCGYGGST